MTLGLVFSARCSSCYIVNDIFNNYITTRRELSQYQRLTSRYYVCCVRVVMCLDIDVKDPRSSPKCGLIFYKCFICFFRRINLIFLICNHRERFPTIKHNFIRRDSRRIKLFLNLIKCHYVISSTPSPVTPAMCICHTRIRDAVLVRPINSTPGGHPTSRSRCRRCHRRHRRIASILIFCMQTAHLQMLPACAQVSALLIRCKSYMFTSFTSCYRI